MIHQTDEELIRICACGNRRAMDVLVSRYHARVLDFAFRHLHDRDCAADIAQTAFIRVFESAAKYRVQASFRTWLYSIALNLVRDEFRRRKSRRESLGADLEMDDEQIAAQAGLFVESPEDTALDRISADEIWLAIGGMSEAQRSAIILKFRQQLTYEEIAEVMGVPSGTVKSWVHYALKSLRTCLGPVDCEV